MLLENYYGVIHSAQTNLEVSQKEFVSHFMQCERKLSVDTISNSSALKFREDKKAWICTTIIPSLFVFIGFMLLIVAAPDRNLKLSVLLDLGDYNPDLKENPCNPILFNSPDHTYTCQPGHCSYGKPYWRMTDSTGELVQ